MAEIENRVKKYRMDNDEFFRRLDVVAELGKVFAVYRDEILKIYRNHPYRPVYSAGIYDYLLETHGLLRITITGHSGQLIRPS